MSLVITQAVAGYGGAPVLREVSIEVSPGSFVALLGPNGAGKTTLLRACAGLLDLRRGSIELDGDDITGWSPGRRSSAGLCLIPDGRAVFPSMTVRENLRLFSPGSADEAVDVAVQAFAPLERLLDRVAGTLSGGEQQMVAMTRAFLVRPRYVLIDEPSMGLAPLIVDQIFAALTEIAATGAAVLLVEQYAQKALAMADDVYVLNRGAVVWSGEAASVDSDALAGSYLT